jgi:3-hydroxypropionyl-CoA synthetase (ADP-forming)
VSLKNDWPPYFVIGNPIDITGSAGAEHYARGLMAMAGDPNIDILVPAFAMQDGPIAHTIEVLHDAFSQINKRGKTFIALAAGGRFTEAQVLRFQSYSVPALPTATRLVKALDKVVSYAIWRQAHNEHQNVRT